MAKEKPLKLTYEEALEQIEQIVERIESGEAGLEQTIAQYEKGVKLIDHCRGILDRVEKRLAELTPDADEQLKVDEPDTSEPQS